ncbi:outer membrane beta-barrel protein [Paraflavitalea speifideaquila]|uniref:outer membrane beta-barrel protein n=1 Tax=Paraflavitalea speifideaquila TaxID=3076558 RepID=UPI0028ED5337|nr:outer membrane beta-barrel protein [Paraflavitalea speifideiaquila]
MALLCTATASAQLHVGARAGANLTKMDNEAFTDHYRLGYAVGGYLYVNFMPFLGVQAEVMFNQTNTEVQSNLSGVYQNLLKGNKNSTTSAFPSCSASMQAS